MTRKRARLDALDRLEMQVSWQDVERRADEGMPTFEPPPPPRRTRLIAAATAFAVFIPVAVFAWVALRSPGEPTLGKGGRGEVVLVLSETGPEGDFPSATVTFDGQAQQGQSGSGGWKGTMFAAERPEFTEFLEIPAGAELVVEGSASSLRVDLADPEWIGGMRLGPIPVPVDLSSGRSVIDVAPGRYVLTVDASWPDGSVPFYFGIEILPNGEPEVFFPTWEMDARPEAIVSGTLVERDGCLFASVQLHEALILWERGLSYAGGAVLDADGNVVIRVGDAFQGGGGYYSASDRAFAEQLVGEPIPDRCLPSLGADGIVLVYDVTPAGSEPAETAITVTSPQPGDAVSTPVTIEGTANVFEGTVRIRIHDAINNVVADTFTTASCGSGCEGSFSIDVGFAVAEEQAGEIVVFEEDAETGKPTNQVRIPVTLLPGPNVEAAQGFIGEWTDASGRPVGEEIVSSSLGAEHCSWGDIVFLRHANPAPPGPTEPITYVRDTTGELAEHTLGAWSVLGEPDAGLEDTGLRVNGRELWVDPTDPSFVILWDPANRVTERWPALRAEIGCA